MRRYALVPLVALVVAGFARSGDEAPPEPRFATITAACNPSDNAQVQPNRVLMRRVDHVEWREPSGRAAAWVISPKDPADWPFPQASYAGTQAAPAVTPTPRPDALIDHPYAYNVTITCVDGSTEVIDPDIIIGDDEDF